MNIPLWQHKHSNTKEFLFSILNKNSLVFLCFLVVSTAFWFLSTLNDFYEYDVKVPLQITDVPRNIVITESLPDSIRITVRDKGFNLIKYSLDKSMPPIRLAFSNYAKNNGKGVITPNDITKIMKHKMSETASIVGVKAEHWDFYYCNGTTKRIPLLPNGVIRPRANYYITRMTLTPDSVTIIASEAALDTINVAYIVPTSLQDVDKSSTYNVNIQSIHGAKIEPKDAKLSIMTDQLTEVMVRVPIRAANVPEGTTLKTFPAQIDVRVTVGVRNSNIVRPERFNVIADYNDIGNDNTNNVPVKITQQPKGIIKAVPMQDAVEYLIESDE